MRIADRFLVISLFFVLLLIFGTGIFCQMMGVPVEKFTSDPASVIDYNPFIGCISNLGILIWTATAAVCLFAGVVVSRDPKRPEQARFLGYAGLLTTVLLLDDFFLIHEVILPEYFHLEENWVLWVYPISVLVFGARFFRLLRRTPSLSFFLAFVFFGLSFSIDIFIEPLGLALHYLCEDGLKLLGIVSWFVYFTAMAVQWCVGEDVHQKSFVK